MMYYLQFQPLEVAIHTNDDWFFYKRGIFACEDEPTDDGLDAIDHAVQLIGYTKNYWIIRN